MACHGSAGFPSPPGYMEPSRAMALRAYPSRGGGNGVEVWEWIVDVTVWCLVHWRILLR